jgi:uncharacterized protein (DUF3084 family)
MEAPGELAQLHKDVGRMMSTLKRADQVNRVKVSRLQQDIKEKLQAAEERIREAESRAQRAEMESERMQKEVDARDHLISQALRK